MGAQGEIEKGPHGWIVATSVQCHPERSEGSDRAAVILSEAKDLCLDQGGILRRSAPQDGGFLGPSALGMTKSGYDGFSSPRWSINA